MTVTEYCPQKKCLLSIVRTLSLLKTPKSVWPYQHMAKFWNYQYLPIHIVSQVEREINSWCHTRTYNYLPEKIYAAALTNYCDSDATQMYSVLCPYKMLRGQSVVYWSHESVWKYILVLHTLLPRWHPRRWTLRTAIESRCWRTGLAQAIQRLQVSGLQLLS